MSSFHKTPYSACIVVMDLSVSGGTEKNSHGLPALFIVNKKFSPVLIVCFAIVTQNASSATTTNLIHVMISIINNKKECYL